MDKDELFECTWCKEKNPLDNKFEIYCYENNSIFSLCWSCVRTFKVKSLVCPTCMNPKSTNKLKEKTE